MTTKIKPVEITLHETTDGQQFDRFHKAEAHQAELDIRQMLEESDIVGSAQDTVIEACQRVLIYVPEALWKDLMK